MLRHGLLPVTLFLVALVASINAVHIRKDAAPITLPFVRRMNITSLPKLLEVDRARAKALRARANSSSGNKLRMDSVISTPATNQVVDYVTTVTVGSPGTDFMLLIDTGSSNTWVGSRPLTNPFIPSRTTELTGKLVEVTYGSGFVLGNQVIDKVSVGPDLTITNQSIGTAILSAGFDDVDGIIGLGPVALTCGTLIEILNTDECIPTVTDNAFSQGLIDAHELGISFEPTTSTGNTNGELTFGGVDTSKFIGPLNFVPITSTAPASSFVGIDQSITFGSPGGTTVLPLTSGITDTGTTLTLIASDAFATYQALTGGVPDLTTGLLRITPEQFANLQSLFFHIGDNTFEFTPNAQIFPRVLNDAIGGGPDDVFLIINDIGSVVGEGLDFVDGMTFLERFYYVFDIANSRVGFATTPLTMATTN